RHCSDDRCGLGFGEEMMILAGADEVRANLGYHQIPRISLTTAYFTRTFLRKKVGTSRSCPSTIVGSLFSKRPRVSGSNCKTSCFAAVAVFSRFGVSASTFGAISGFFFGGMIRGLAGRGA